MSTVNQGLEEEREADPALPRFFFHNTHIPNFCHLSPEYCFLSQYRISYPVTDTRWKAIEREEKGHFGCVRSAKGARGRRCRAQIPFLLAFESSVTPCESARALQLHFRYALWSTGQYIHKTFTCSAMTCGTLGQESIKITQFCMQNETNQGYKIKYFVLNRITK